MTAWLPLDPASLSIAEVVAYLRARCPWAAAHTHATLAPYLLEETYELLDALDAYSGESGDAQKREELIGELGDVLYQVLFHSAVLDQPESTPDAHTPPTGQYVEPNAWHEVVETLKAKIVRRHPHVFNTYAPVDIDEVERVYEEIKQTERKDQPAASPFASIPRNMPALTRAQQVLSRAARVGDVREATETSAKENLSSTEVGEQLFTLVAQAKAAGIDAEAALRTYVDDWIDKREERNGTNTH